MSHNDLTAEQVRELLDYDPATGVLTWKRRDPSLFEDGPRQDSAHVCAIWNGKYAGTVAGSFGSNGCRKIHIDGKDYKAHRVIWLYMTGEWPEQQIDHKNGTTSDNRWKNLREATPMQNGQNMRRPGHNTSGYIGVSKYFYGDGWVAQIKHKRKMYHLGIFETKEDAFAAYLAAKKKYHTFQPVPREHLAQHGV